MHPTRIFLIFSVLCVSRCYTGNAIKTTNSVESKLLEAVVNIVESCYGDRITPVGLAGNLTGMISKTMWYEKNPPATLINTGARLVNDGPVHPKSRYKLQVFVVTASSSITLSETFRGIKASIWWNHMAAFLIVDWSLSNHSCSNAFEVLWAAWEMNTINANFICHHRTRGRLIYTYNPYTSQAPDTWQLEKTYSGLNKHPWTLFVREYEDKKGVCIDLDFEKANDLGGYEIRVSSFQDPSYDSGSTKSNRVCFGLFDDIVCDIIFPALNATPKVLLHDSVNSVGFVDEKGNVSGILAEISNGLSDVGFTFRYVTSMSNLSYTYPLEPSELRSITQYSGYKSQLSKINSVIDIKSRFCVSSVALITIFFFKYFLRQPAMVALLSTVRIISNSALPKIPKKLAPRIYFGSLFLFVLTIQGIYQGQLALLLTKQEPLRNVNTMKDLAELGHTIYGFVLYRLHFNGPEFEGRYVGLKKFTCAEYVISDHTAACVADKYYLMFRAAKSKLHVSRHTLVPIHAAFPIRPDWPLEQRVNALLMTSVEALGMRYLIQNATYQAQRFLDVQENEYKDQSAVVLNLEQLGFAFAILGTGLGCATVIFVIELRIGRYLHGGPNNVLMQVRNRRGNC